MWPLGPFVAPDSSCAMHDIAYSKSVVAIVLQSVVGGDHSRLGTSLFLKFLYLSGKLGHILVCL